MTLEALRQGLRSYLRHPATWVFLGVLLAASGCSIAYYQMNRAALVEREQEAFLGEAKVRHARLLAEIERKRQLLAVAQHLIAGVDVVSENHLRGFVAGGLLGEAEEFCWIRSDRQRVVSSATVSPARACDFFDALEPSRIFGAPPQIVLSAFAPTQTGEQGFASLRFDVHALALEPPRVLHREYLVVSDAAQHKTQSYELASGALAPRPSGVVQAGAKVFDLGRYGDVAFVYVATAVETQADWVDLSLLAALLALSFFLAVLASVMMSKHDAIAKEVRWRTDELNQFAYRTSHDLRGPLITVAGLCKFMADDLEAGEVREVERNIARIKAHVERLAKLVTDILELSRADLQAQVDEQVSLATLVDEATRLVRTTQSDHGVEIRTQGVANSVVPLARARMAQILENLVSNGVKYRNPAEPHPYVAVNAEVGGRKLLVTVRDNGVGIPESFHPRVFQMFERFHPELGKEGSGLGLSIVKKHIDRMGGTVMLSSNTAGTTVHLSIPIS